jgi:hypothetical protein
VLVDLPECGVGRLAAAESETSVYAYVMTSGRAMGRERVDPRLMQSTRRGQLRWKLKCTHLLQCKVGFWVGLSDGEELLVGAEMEG